MGGAREIGERSIRKTGGDGEGAYGVERKGRRLIKEGSGSREKWELGSEKRCYRKWRNGKSEGDWRRKKRYQDGMIEVDVPFDFLHAR